MERQYIVTKDAAPRIKEEYASNNSAVATAKLV